MEKKYVIMNCFKKAMFQTLCMEETRLAIVEKQSDILDRSIKLQSDA